MRIHLALCGICGFLLSLSGQALAADPIRIGLDGPFTGGTSPSGISMRNGVHLAVDEINRAGGVLGRPLLLIERDDESKNELGVQIAQEFIDKEKVVAVLGIANTGVVLAASRFYQEAGIPLLINVAAATVIPHQFDDQPANFIFRLSTPDFIQSHMIVDEAITRRGFRKVAILADTTNYGQLGRADLEKALAAKSLAPVDEEKFNIGDVDMTAQLLKAKEAGAEALLVYGIGRELAQLSTGMVKIGWKVPMIGCWSLAQSNYIDAAGPAGEGTRMPLSFIQEPTTPKRRAFIADYVKQFAPKLDRMEASAPAAQGYDSAYLLAAAIRQAGSTDGIAIKSALEDLRDPVEGVIMTYVKPFSKTDHEALTANIPALGEVKGQRVVYAYDSDLKDAGRPKVKDPDANKF